MKNSTCTLLLSLFFVPCFAQDTTKVIQKDSTGSVHVNIPKEGRRGSVLLVAEHVRNSNFSTTAFGIGFNVPVGKHMGLNYRFALGSSSDRRFYYRGSLGGTAGGWLLGQVGDGLGSGFLEALGVIMFFVPEGVTVSTPIGKKLEMVHYLNPLCADYLDHSDPSKEEFYVTGEIGSSFMFPLSNRIYAKPHAGMKYYYKTGKIAPEGGVSIGMYFKD